MTTTLTLLDELLSQTPDARRAHGAPAELATDVRWPETAPVHGGGPTLDEVIAGAWEGLTAGRPVPCPVCGGGMSPRYGAGQGPVAASCDDCGSTLS